MKFLGACIFACINVEIKSHISKPILFPVVNIYLNAVKDREQEFETRIARIFRNKGNPFYKTWFLSRSLKTSAFLMSLVSPSFTSTSAGFNRELKLEDISKP